MGVTIVTSDAVVPDARRVAAVMEDTWGHLRVRPRVRHHGQIVFAEGIYGGDGIVTLRCDFPTLNDGPWFYDALIDFLLEQETEPGQVYRWTGWYRLTKAHGDEFVGTVDQIEIP